MGRSNRGTSNKRRGVLRLKKKPSQHITSQLEEGESEGMHAVANGEREAFSTAGNNGTHLEAESPPPSETEAAVNGNKAAYNKPCPKSRKSRDDDCDGREEESRDSDADVLEEEPPGTEAVEGEDVVGGHVEDVEDNVEEQNVVEEEAVVEDNVAEEDGAEDPAEVQQEEEEDIASDVAEDRSDELSAAGSSVQLNGNEGIVTEPEDHADQESCNGTDPDVTISFVDGDDGEVSDSDEVSGRERPSTTEPLVEFPTDSPGKIPASPRRDLSDVEEDDETESVANENQPESDDPMIDVLNTSTGSDYKVLHHLSKPTHHITSNQKVVKESEYVGNAAYGRSSTERESDYSFGRSLRTLSGRRPMKHFDREESGTPAESSYTKFFSFGKRKGEDLPKQEPEPKRAKPEEGVDSMGFFARLTSPVMNRLRAIKVGAPAAAPTSSVAGEEVEGKEEMAVAHLEAQPASKRCVLM